MQRQFIRALVIVLFSYIVIVYTGPELIFILLIANFVSIRVNDEAELPFKVVVENVEKVFVKV